MKIKELKEELKKINPEATIILTVGTRTRTFFQVVNGKYMEIMTTNI